MTGRDHSIYRLLTLFLKLKFTNFNFLPLLILNNNTWRSMESSSGACVFSSEVLNPNKLLSSQMVRLKQYYNNFVIFCFVSYGIFCSPHIIHFSSSEICLNAQKSEVKLLNELHWGNKFYSNCILKISYMQLTCTTI